MVDRMWDVFNAFQFVLYIFGIVVAGVILILLLSLPALAYEEVYEQTYSKKKAILSALAVFAFYTVVIAGGYILFGGFL